MFDAVLVEKDDVGYRCGLRSLQDDMLPAGDVTVRVEYSTLNYKDALAITGFAPVVRSFPMVPGIDFAGTVEASQSPAFQPGDAVVLNGWGVGEQHWGGLSQKARVKSDWLIPLPSGFTARNAMAVGTAGYTAMLSVMALQEHGLRPEDGDIIVTGANGGVGTLAILLLSHLGYRVTASTGRPEEKGFLEKLGASEIIDRRSLAQAGKPLQAERWAGAIDTVGSHTLANICASTRSEGIVTACGLAQGMDFPATVAPFILRGVTLRGINSVTQPRARRIEAWNRLAADMDFELLEALTREIGLADAIEQAQVLMNGSVRGRLIVDVNR